MKRGPKVKTKCLMCGVIKTPSNTYIRPSGGFYDVCKACNTDRTYINNMKKLATEELELKLEDHKWRVRQMQDEIKRRAKNENRV